MFGFVRKSKYDELVKKLKSMEADYEVYLQNKERYEEAEERANTNGECLGLITQQVQRAGINVTFVDDAVEEVVNELLDSRTIIGNIRKLVTPATK